MKLVKIGFVVIFSILMCITSENSLEDGFSSGHGSTQTLSLFDAFMLFSGTMSLAFNYGFSLSVIAPPILKNEVQQSANKNSTLNNDIALGNIVEPTLAIFSSISSDPAFSTSTLPNTTVSSLGLPSTISIEHFKRHKSSTNFLIPFLQSFTISSHLTLVTSAFPAGAVLISVATIFLTKKLISKQLLCLSALFSIFGLVLLITSQCWIQFLFGRLFLGFSSGIAVAFLTVILSEIGEYHPSIGKVSMAIFPIFISLGVLICNIMKYYLLDLLYDTWRLLYASNLVVSIFGFFCLFKSTPPMGSRLKKFQENTSSKKLHITLTKTKVDLREALGPGRKSIIIYVLGHVFQVFSFLNGYFFYTTLLFPDIKEIGIIMGIFYLIGTILNTILMMAKRDLTEIGVISSVGCGLASFLVACSLSTSFLLGAKIGVALFMVFYRIGFGPVPWIAGTKIFPLEYRPFFSTIGSIINWSLSLILTLLIPSLFKAIGEYSFILFGIFCLLYGYMLYFHVPELDNHTGFLKNEIYPFLNLSSGKTIHEAVALDNTHSENEDPSVIPLVAKGCPGVNGNIEAC